jgi:hypothetical protein
MMANAGGALKERGRSSACSPALFQSALYARWPGPRLSEPGLYSLGLSGPRASGEPPRTHLSRLNRYISLFAQPGRGCVGNQPVRIPHPAFSLPRAVVTQVPRERGAWGGVTEHASKTTRRDDLNPSPKPMKRKNMTQPKPEVSVIQARASALLETSKRRSTRSSRAVKQPQPQVKDAHSPLPKTAMLTSDTRLSGLLAPLASRLGPTLPQAQPCLTASPISLPARATPVPLVAGKSIRRKNHSDTTTPTGLISCPVFKNSRFCPPV